MKKHTGFTIIELMVTLVIVGIVVGVGVPSLKTMLQINQLIAAPNELHSALHVARSEAIKLNTRVSVCESSNGTSCATTGDWTKGWIVFIDANGNLAGTGAVCTASGTDCLLRVHRGFTDKSLSATGVLDGSGVAISSITFTSRGLPKSIDGSSQSGVFSICSFDPADNVTGSRAVVLSLTGRARVSKNTSITTCPATPPA